MIAAGDYDRYLRGYADAVRNFGHAVVIGFGHEMSIDGYYYRRSDSFATVFGRTISQVRLFCGKALLLGEI